MNEIGTFCWFGYELPLAERLSMVAQAGFKRTCLWLAQEEPLVASGRRDDMPKLARDAGLAVDNVHAPYQHCNLLWANSEAERRVVRSEYEDALVFCARHGIPIVVAHVAEGLTPPPQTDHGFEVLRDLAAFAEDCGVVLALENTRRPDYLEPVFERIASPSLGFCYDSSHDFLPQGTFGNILSRWSARLVTTHLSDNDGEQDDHSLPGEGKIPWARVKRAFPTGTYSGRVMLEAKTKNPDLEHPMDFLRRAYTVALNLQKVLGTGRRTRSSLDV